jgi:hypothetical protein
MRPSTRGRIVVDERMGVPPAPKCPQPLDRVSPMKHRFEAIALLFHIRDPMLSYASENPIRRRPRFKPIIANFVIVASSKRPANATPQFGRRYCGRSSFGARRRLDRAERRCSPGPFRGHVGE